MDEWISRRKRSPFLTEATEQRRRPLRLLVAEAAAGSLKDVDIPGWETPESTSEWVRALRPEADERVERAWNPRR